MNDKLCHFVVNTTATQTLHTNFLLSTFWKTYVNSISCQEKDLQMTALGVFTGEPWYAALARCVALRYKSPAFWIIQR